ncbi:GNAT family N-acetyltransferase [Clostridium sp. YIM B02555]|uniref:GNAT family N-acetyltransferase n=1 Tax=Clostridium sp. YIM B02555 TaxID=2911968 RepID=UPI001EEDE49C|nr:GNAT family N-acetyltransferase [Clostridium sp. YIM B02555]
MEQMIVKKLEEYMIDECVDLYIDTFSREPWNDVFESRVQVLNFFNNHIKNNYFLGYVAIIDEKITALSIGMKKPWIEGMEYYIDEFCVSYSMQGNCIGSEFLKEIEKMNELKGVNSIILNTEKGYPSYDFYIKNGFNSINDLVVLGK